MEARDRTFVSVSKTRVRFVLFRVEADAWEHLPTQLRPAAPPATDLASR
jgi:hypothetical protein